MLEIPETAVLAKQLNNTVPGKRIRRAVAAQSPHKFAWFSGDPASYPGRLTGKTMGTAAGLGGLVEIQVEDSTLVLGDVINLRYHPTPTDQPPKHQLLVEFDDFSALSVTIAMYGGIWCMPAGTNENPYYLAAREKPSPLGNSFTEAYFSGLFSPEALKLPLKAFLATQQRIPGLGNGVLQDILYWARLHPKTKAASLDESGRLGLYHSVRNTVAVMTEQGGRDTERDLFGSPGGYVTQMSRNTVGKSCPACASLIVKQAYMGGSIYFCPGCQKEG